MATHQTAPPAAAPQQTRLTDDLLLPDQTGPIPAWSGCASPVPPGVRTEYWRRLYNRADSRHQAATKKIWGKDANTRAQRLAVTAQLRELGETYDLALDLLILDVVSCDVNQGAGNAAVQAKKAALLATRAK
ncbi:hypothetical protein OQA88_3519 [Cercophora sp. LCS_1]